MTALTPEQRAAMEALERELADFPHARYVMPEATHLRTLLAALREREATLAAVREHAKDFQDADGESAILGILDCPHHEPLHYHHDGCPACETRGASEREGRDASL